VFYFVAFAVIGMFFVVAMVISVFQDGFALHQKESLKKERLFDRTGLVAAFVLLDIDQSGMYACCSPTL
jgi:hypothetical protein